MADLLTEKCRADQLDAAEREAERRRLEHRFAVEYAKQSVESFFVLESWVYGWYRKPNDLNKEDAQFLRDALRYLDLCGLLERREGEPDVVRIKDNVAIEPRR